MKLGDTVRHTPTGFTGRVIRETLVENGQRYITLEAKRVIDPLGNFLSYTINLDATEPFDWLESAADEKGNHE